LLEAEKLRVDEQRTKGYAPPVNETLAEFFPRYLAFQKPRLTERSFERTSGIIEKHLQSVFGSTLIGSIRRVDIEQYVTRRAGEVSAACVVKEVNVLKHLLSLAVEWDLIPFNPAAKVKAPRVPAGRVRYLQPGELRELLAACPDWLRPIVALAAFTAMRRGEILGLRWLNVDLNGRRILLSQAKNGDGRVVYLNNLAVQVLRSKWIAGAKLSDRIFPLADRVTLDDISKGFAAVCRRIGLEDFRFHDLRHTAASWLRMQGADIHTVAQLLGHKDLRMATRYQHLSPEFLSDAVGRLDSVFGKPAQFPAETPTPPGCATFSITSRSIVTTASPELSREKSDENQAVDLFGSAIGDRTRTLRLERAAC